MTSRSAQTAQYVGAVARATTMTVARVLASAPVSSLMLVLALAGPAQAVMPLPLVQPPPVARPLVAVVRAAGAEGGPRHDDATQEIATRVIAELMAAGIAVMAAACDSGDVACMSPSQLGLVATVLVADEPAGPTIEVRATRAARATRALPTARVTRASAAVPPRAERPRSAATTPTPWVHRLGSDVDGESRPAALAIRTVELVRALLLDSAADAGPAGSVAVAGEAQAQVAEGTPPTEDGGGGGVTAQKNDDEGADGDPAPEAIQHRSALPPERPRLIAASMGVAVMTSFSGIGPSYGPSFRLVRQTSKHVALSLILAGPLFASKLEAPSGTVRVRQEMAVAEVSVGGHLGAKLRPRAGIAAGAYHIAVNGNVYDLGYGRQDGAFCLAFAWSVGLVADFRPGVGVFLDASMVLLTPTPVVLLRGFELGRAGNPGMLVASGIELRF
jgi:hypothetical protein